MESERVMDAGRGVVRVVARVAGWYCVSKSNTVVFLLPQS